jgi:hypothetical protein
MEEEDAAKSFDALLGNPAPSTMSRGQEEDAAKSFDALLGNPAPSTMSRGQGVAPTVTQGNPAPSSTISRGQVWHRR